MCLFDESVHWNFIWMLAKVIFLHSASQVSSVKCFQPLSSSWSHNMKQLPPLFEYKCSRQRFKMMNNMKQSDLILNNILFIYYSMTYLLVNNWVCYNQWCLKPHVAVWERLYKGWPQKPFFFYSCHIKHSLQGYLFLICNNFLKFATWV